MDYMHLISTVVTKLTSELENMQINLFQTRKNVNWLVNNYMFSRKNGQIAKNGENNWTFSICRSPPLPPLAALQKETAALSQATVISDYNNHNIICVISV
jgi:hypothetical protein